MHRAPTRFALALSALALGIALPAVAEMRIEKTLKLDPGGEFRLDTDMGKVTLVGSSDSDVHVVLTSRRKDLDELMTFRWDETPGLVSITARKRQKFSWFSNSGSSVQYEVRVPTQTRVSVETSGGGINITGIQGEVKADTSGGGIGITNVAGASLPKPRGAESRSRTSRAASWRIPRAGASTRSRSRARSAPRAPAVRSSSNG